MIRIALAAAVLSLAACGGGEPGRSVRPPGVGVLTEGRAEVRVRGALRTRFDVPLDGGAINIYQHPRGGFALTWGGQDQPAVGIGGPLFEGTRVTGNGLSVTLTAPDEGLPVVFTSFDGECQVTLVEVERDRLDGTFSCVGLSARGLVIDATGTFSASG
ncbi:MAG TPA: hypothetical protein VHL78_10200 [Actinomycetota bacterium]|nr:hypothetical protein [Actinomycetota bacterium]